MKKVIFLFFCICTSCIYSQNFAWAKSGIGMGTGVGGDEGYANCTDAAGNIYITGGFDRQSVVFGTYTLTNLGPYDPSGNYDAYLVKYDGNGNVLWAKDIGGSGNSDYGISVSTDPSGNVFLIAAFNSSIITVGTTTFAPSAFAHIIKFDASGNFIWTKPVAGSPSSVNNDGSGNVFVTGYYLGTSAVYGSYTLTSSSYGNNIFLTKYDTNGNVLWAKGAVGTSTYNCPYTISSDASGNAYIVGQFKGPTLTIGTTTLNYTYTGLGYGLFIAKFDMNGSPIWAKSPNGTINNIFWGRIISTEPNGTSYITGGYASSNITFGTYTLSGAFNMFLAKYDTNGNPLWAKGSSGGAKGVSVSSYSAGVFVTASVMLSNTVSVGTITLTTPTNSIDPIIIANYDTNGNVMCASVLASGGDDVSGVIADQSGNAYITSDFQPNPFTVGSTTLTTTGVEDIFTAKYNCLLTGIETYSDNSIFKIYPNPIASILNIKTSFYLNSPIEITNYLGEIVLKKVYSETIDVSQLNPGCYFIRVGNSYSKFIKE
jgi:hypothetical protein